jgi:hypothetical protein
MPDRRGRKGSLEDFLPADRVSWAQETWRERDKIAELPSGAWMLRIAAETLGKPEEEVDQLLRDLASRNSD